MISNISPFSEWQRCGFELFAQGEQRFKPVISVSVGSLLNSVAYLHPEFCL